MHCPRPVVWDSMHGMKPADILQASTSEEAALALLLDICWAGGRRFCPRCGADHLYALSGGRYRCAGCKYTFQDFAGRWINNGGLSPATWLRLIRLFADEATAHQTAAELGLSYNATYKAVTTLRFAILAHAPDARQLLGPETGLGAYLKGSKLTGVPAARGRGPIPVFGILERNGWVFIDLVSGISAETVFHFNHNFHLRIERAGYLVHTAPYRQYDALVLSGDDTLPYEYIRKVEPANSQRREGAFTRYAVERIKAFKGVSPQRFPLYLKELEFRYNRRLEPLEPLLLRYLCDMVPDIESRMA